MRYPMMNKQPVREVNIPNLSGGLNLRDSLTGVRDNQLTECVNMWYKNGVLRTRPSIVTSNAMIKNSVRSNTDEKVNTRFHNEIKIEYNGAMCICATNKRIIKNTDDNTLKCNIEFEFQSENKIFAMPSIENISAENEVSYFLCEMDGVLYCYISDLSIWRLFYAKEYKTEEEKPIWEKVDIKNRYVPTVYLHCQRTGWDDFNGTFFEGYNIIGNSYKMIYSAYNENDSDKSHPMRYALGQDLPPEGEIKVEIATYKADGEDVLTTEHSIVYGKEDYENFKNGKILIEKFSDGKTPEDNLYLFVKYNYVGFLSNANADSSVFTLETDEKVKKYGCNEDNITITAPVAVSEENLKKVFCMTRCTWFGGYADGINGGSRLFLCGNTDKKEKSLVVWSGLNEPLYFGENCYSYVGRKSQAVTAFGKQGEKLILFKENKIYYTYYAENNDITADDLINQSVIDYGANSVYFPMIQLNGFIGCDCPDTVQMCRNRLVWANSIGKVYTLYTINQYNEHNVYDMSEMIAPKLKEYRNLLKNATSADFDGHYILFLGDCAFVADYCCYGYQYIYSYSKTEDANSMIPWYYWKFDFIDVGNNSDVYQNASICMLGNSLLMRAYFNASVNGKTAFVGFTSGDKTDCTADYMFFNDFKEKSLKLCESKIKCKAATKLFEFGNGVYTINVEGITVNLGANNGDDIKIKFITEQGEEVTVVSSNREFTAVNAPNYFKPKRIYPCMRAILKFGIELECEGLLAIDGISVKYRLLGDAKE